jgi:hypothetical protein
MYRLTNRQLNRDFMIASILTVIVFLIIAWWVVPWTTQSAPMENRVSIFDTCIPSDDGGYDCHGVSTTKGYDPKTNFQK